MLAIILTFGIIPDALSQSIVISIQSYCVNISKIHLPLSIITLNQAISIFYL